MVIGILIALQINTWNEERKERAYEVKMLTEVHKSLLADIKDKVTVLELFKEATHSVNELIKMREDPDYPRDSVTNHLDNIKNLGLFFPYSDGAFEAIKASGLDKISNDALRDELVHLYSYTFPSVSIFVNDVVRPSMIQKFEKFEEVFPGQLHSGADGKASTTYSYDGFEQVIHSPDFNAVLKLSNLLVSSITPRLESLVRRMNRMAEMIETEINP